MQRPPKTVPIWGGFVPRWHKDGALPGPKTPPKRGQATFRPKVERLFPFGEPRMQKGVAFGDGGPEGCCYQEVTLALRPAKPGASSPECASGDEIPQSGGAASGCLPLWGDVPRPAPPLSQTSSFVVFAFRPLAQGARGQSWLEPKGLKLVLGGVLGPGRAPSFRGPKQPFGGPLRGPPKGCLPRQTPPSKLLAPKGPKGCAPEGCTRMHNFVVDAQ